MKKEKNKPDTFLLGQTVVTDIIWMPNSDGSLRPRVVFQPLMGLRYGKEIEITKATGYGYSFLNRLGVSKGSKVEICAVGEKENPFIIYVNKVVEAGNGDMGLPQNTFIFDGEAWDDTEKCRKYVAFRKGLKELLEWAEIKSLFDCGITDVISLAEYLQRHDHLTVIRDLSIHWVGQSKCLIDSAINLKQKFANLDYFELLKLLNLPKLRNCELKIIALRMSGYDVAKTSLKNIRRKSVEEFLKNHALCNRIKAVAKPTAKAERMTIVGKEGDSVTIEIRNLPKRFSFAYAFFRNIEQEHRLLNKELENAHKNGNKATSEYLESAQQFFKEHPVPDNFYAGGVSNSPVLDVIQTLAFEGELLFTTSVAKCVKNRIDIEIDAIHQEYECCKALSSIIPDKVDQVITIMREAKNEEETVEKLQSEMSLSSGAAECLRGVTLSTLTDKDLLSQKVKSMKFLLAYLKYLKTINT